MNNRTDENAESTWQGRLTTERNQLSLRLEKLRGFLDGGPTDELASLDLQLLKEQETIMSALLNVLKQRMWRAGLEETVDAVLGKIPKKADDLPDIKTLKTMTDKVLSDRGER